MGQHKHNPTAIAAKEKRGIEIDFGKHFYPDLFTLKAEYLEWIKTKVDGGEA